MKKMNYLLMLATLTLTTQTMAEGLELELEQQKEMAAQTQGQVIVNKSYNYSDRPLNVSGEVEEEELAPDSELQFINNELTKQQRTHKLNKEKTKGYKKLKQTTEKLVDSTEEYVGERKESEGLIKDYNKQIKCLLQENSYDPDCKKEEDKVQVQQAAPAIEAPSASVPVPVAAPVLIEEVNQVEEKSDFLETMKVLPAVSLINYTGENIGNIESNTGLDIKVESNVFSRLAIGLGFNYHAVDFTDIPVWGYGQYYQPNYYGTYGSFGREVVMEAMGVDLYGKLFIFKDARVKPYLSAAIGFKRLNFEYKNNNSYNYNSFYNFGNESYTTNIIDGKVGAGVEFSFSNNIGVFAELTYGMGVTEFGGSQTTWSLPDELRLEELSNEFTGSGVFAITGGMSFSF